MSPTRYALALLLGALALGPSPALPQAAFPQANPFTPRDERVEDLPEGAGREETFGMCSACHAYRLVSNQGMTRQRWDETLTWMTERHNMPALAGADRDLVLDYLAKAHPSKASPAGGFRNPFAPQ